MSIKKRRKINSFNQMVYGYTIIRRSIYLFVGLNRHYKPLLTDLQIMSLPSVCLHFNYLEFHENKYKLQGSLKYTIILEIVIVAMR